MDHKEQHHQHHQKEREEKKKEQHKHEQDQMKKPGSIHPLWFAVVGVVLVVVALTIWTFFWPWQ
jgi:cytoskeletal protein RodZ